MSLLLTEAVFSTEQTASATYSSRRPWRSGLAAPTPRPPPLTPPLCRCATPPRAPPLPLYFFHSPVLLPFTVPVGRRLGLLPRDGLGAQGPARERRVSDGGAALRDGGGIVELLCTKAVQGEEPARVLHFNPRIRGDFSGRPVIELNTCYRMQIA